MSRLRSMISIFLLMGSAFGQCDPDGESTSASCAANPQTVKRGDSYLQQQASVSTAARANNKKIESRVDAEEDQEQDVTHFAGVPVHDFSLRKPLKNGQVEWIVTLKPGTTKQHAEALCNERVGKASCDSHGNPFEGAYGFANLLATDQELEGILRLHSNLTSFVQPSMDILIDKPMMPNGNEPQRAYKFNPHARSKKGTTGCDNSYSWALDRIDQRELPLDGKFDVPFDGEGVSIYVFDTGIGYDHEEFDTDCDHKATRAIPALTFREGKMVVCDEKDKSCAKAPPKANHGTMVASAAGGSRFGVAKKATLRSVQLYNKYGFPTWKFVESVNWVAENAKKPAVVVMSLGASFTKEKAKAQSAAFSNLLKQGIIPVVSAGNDKDPTHTKLPAALKETAIVVASSTKEDERSSFSNFGKSVDLYAPGSNVRVGSSGADGKAIDKYTTTSGTSFSAPFVAGVIALWLQASKDYPGMNSDLHVKRLLESVTKDVIKANKDKTTSDLLFTDLNMCWKGPKGNPLYSFCQKSCKSLGALQSELGCSGYHCEECPKPAPRWFWR